MEGCKLADKLNLEYIEMLQVSIWRVIHRMPKLVGSEYPSVSTDSVCCCVRQPPLTKRRSSRNHTTSTTYHQTKYNICFCPLSSEGCKKSSSAGNSGFTALPDHLLVSIMTAVSSTSSSPADLVNAMLACKKLWSVGRNPQVLKNAASPLLKVTVAKWAAGAHCFLKQCADAGNTEACYILGMIYFYSLGLRKWGVSLMAKAAIQAHGPAFQSLAVIQFNGSGGRHKYKDLTSAITLCAAGACVGYMDAMWELGHCLLTGYGAVRNVSLGSSILWKANDLGKVAASSPPTVHMVNRFLVDWFNLFPLKLGLHLCSLSSCGRPETRKYEFKSCSACDSVQYCSKACQNWDWKFRHKDECRAKVMKAGRKLDRHNNENLLLQGLSGRLIEKCT